MNKTAIIIEDDQLSRFTLKHLLEKDGFQVLHEFSSMAEVFEKYPRDEGQVTVVFVDLDLEEELAGLKILENVIPASQYSIVLTGRESDKIILSAYEKGCNDYLQKPFSREKLSFVCKRINLSSDADNQVSSFIRALGYTDSDLSNSIREKAIHLFSDGPLFLSGETGTGKTHIAKLIHQSSLGESKPFIHLNCSELPDNLLESELFGFKKGAFSGADRDKKGKLLEADGGTLFLDEIATMSSSLQMKLLRVIEDGEFSPLGSNERVTSSFRLISATCEDLELHIKEGRFRQDLYFRIQGVKLALPALRERKNDIPGLVKFILSNKHRKIVLTESALELVVNYSWPGNIRELTKVLNILSTGESGIVHREDIERVLPLSRNTESGIVEKDENGRPLDDQIIELVENGGLKKLIQDIEDTAVRYFYDKHERKVRPTIKELRISNSAFYRIINRLEENRNELR